MSDSSLSDTGPDDSVLEQELRQIVERIFESGDLEELTVKRVRSAAEENLGLREGFFKGAEWKDKSKTIIEGEVQARNEASGSQQASSPVKPKSKPPKAAARPAKRPSPDEPEPKKRRKLAKGRETKKKGIPSDEELEEEVAISEEKEPKQMGLAGESRKKTGLEDDSVDEGDPAPEKKSNSKQLEEESSSLSDVDGNASAPEEAEKQPIVPAPDAAENSESELSELIDEEPKPKKRKKRSPKAKEKKEPKKRGRKSTQKQELDPNAEEIKRLQGWLVKCGIRKMWARELKPYDTPKEKIRHLKEMLSDAGMTGRYSIEKAARIRETRELQADLEAVQEGEKRWGNVEEVKEPPKVRSRGMPSIDDLESDSD